MNTNQFGVVVSRSDYMPYGEEIAGLGGRSSSDKYVSDDVRQGFTGYEKDSETDMDYAEARTYSSKFGRFYNSDPLEIAFETKTTRLIAFLGTPQNWNKYSYVRNNPMINFDKDGREPNKAQAGTVQQVVAIIQEIERRNPQASQSEVLKKTDEFFRNQVDEPGAVRYVYTKESGWIDMKHFFAAAQSASTTSAGEVLTNAGGLLIEIDQTLQGDDSGFSYEDLGSNAAGADFGDEAFNSEGGPVSAQVMTYFVTQLGPQEPTTAPNYPQIPARPSNTQSGSRTTQTASARTPSTQSTRSGAKSTSRTATDSANSRQRRTANRTQSDSRGRSRKRNR